MMIPEASLMAAFLAGLISFLSPGVLPLVPSYINYISGLSLDQLAWAGERQDIRRNIVVNALLFIAGFSAVFIAFRTSASLLSQFLTGYQDVVRKIGGILIIGFGLSLMGIVTPTVPIRERRFSFGSRLGCLGAVLIGAAFAAGWTPCVGPMLGTVLIYPGTTETITDSVTLLIYYSLGLGLPLLAIALGVNRFLVSFKPVRDYVGIMSTVNGVALAAFGLVLFTNALPVLAAFFERHGIGSSLRL